MLASIEPEPPAAEREAILAALAGVRQDSSAWAEAALAEAVEGDELEP